MSSWDGPTLNQPCVLTLCCLLTCLPAPGVQMAKSHIIVSRLAKWRALNYQLSGPHSNGNDLVCEPHPCWLCRAFDGIVLDVPRVAPSRTCCVTAARVKLAIVRKMTSPCVYPETSAPGGSCRTHWGVPDAATLQINLPSKHPMLCWCWTAVFDVGPTSKQHWVNVSCLHLSARLESF